MNANNIFPIFISCFFTFFATAQSTYNAKSSITEAVIYERGAMITRSINTDEISEAGTIIIDSLPKGIYRKSLQVNSGNGIKIISVKYEVKQEKSELPESYNRTQKKTLVLQDSINYFSTILSSVRHEIAVIEDNNDFKTEQGVNIDQISKALELYKSRLRALKMEQYDIQLNSRRINNRIQILNSELREQSVKIFNNSRAIIKIEKPTSSDRTLTLSYFTPNATWYTFYNLRVDDDKTKSVLDHKAYVSQSTGEEWKDVKLTLSNRNPQKRITPPSMNPYRLQNVNHRMNGQYENTRPKMKEINAMTGYIQGIITDIDGEALIGANIVMKGSTHDIVTDIDGSFLLQIQNGSLLVVSYTGYETREVNISGLSSVNIILSERALLDELVITESGISRSKKALGYAVSGIKSSFESKKQERKSISIKEQQSLNVSSFEILRPYTIPSNGEEYDVLLKTSEVPFEFNYLIYPSIDPIAYLNVGIPEWRDHNLFSGNVNLFLMGQYTGVSQINIAEKNDTLWFSLGEDIGVNVERSPVKEYNKKSFFKNKTIELQTFDIEIKNNKNKSINIIVMDQVPISTDEDIKVKVLEISGAEYEEDSGFLKWKSDLSKAKKKKYRISYEIKYGKHVDIINR